MLIGFFWRMDILVRFVCDLQPIIFVQYTKCEWKREKYNFLREFGETKCLTLFSRYKVLVSFAATWDKCLSRDKCSSR
jgi:hypothetical protein